MASINKSQKIVTVCDKCLTESCLRGVLTCVDAAIAGTITDTEEAISKLVPSEAVLAEEGQVSPETRALAEDTFGRIEKSIEARDRFAKRFGV